MNDNTIRIELTTLIPFPAKGRLTDRQIDNKVAKMLELKAQEKELAKQRETLENELKTYMGKTEELKGKHYKVSYKVEPYNPFDSKSFAQKHPKLWKKFHGTDGTRRRFLYDTI